MPRPGPWRRFVVRPLVWALALAALAVLGLRLFLRSDLARSRGRALVEARLSEAIGRPVTVGGFDFELMPFSVVATGLVIPGDREGAADFARVERLEVEADLEGWRRSVIELRRVYARGVRVALEFRADGDNLPRFRRGRGGERSFTVRVDGLTIEDGEVTVDERKARVEVDARAVLARFSGLGGTDLEGVVTAQEVALRLPKARPVSFALSAKARLLADHLEFSNARVTAPDFAARASGQVRWRGGTSVDLAASLDASGAFLDRLGYLDGDLSGPVHAEGTFGWRRAGWGWRADLSSPGLDLFGFRVEQLAGEARGGRDEARFDLERGTFAGGAVRGSLAVRLEGPDFPATLDVALDGAPLDAVLARFQVPARGLAGAVVGALRYDFDLVRAARGSGGGEFEVVARAAGGPDAAPATGRASVRLEEGELVLPAFALELPAQRVAGSARLALGSGEGRVDLTVASEDLGRLVPHLALLEPGAIWLPGAGTGELTVAVELAAGGAARTEVALELAAFAAPGLAADSVSGTLTASGSALEALDLHISRGVAALDLAGRVPLDPRQPGLDLDLTIEGWPVEEARPWLPFDLPLAGRAHGRLRLAGSAGSPTGTLAASLEPVTVAGVPAIRLDTELEWDAVRLAVARARWVSEAGEIEGRGSLRFEGEQLDFELASPGLELGRAPLDLVARERLGGRLVFEARLAGALSSPEGELDGRLEALALNGAPLEGGPATITARAAGGRLDLDLSLPELARVRGGGSFALDRPSRLALRLDSERLDRLVALAAGPELGAEVAGRLGADLDLAWSGDEPLRLGVIVPELELTWGGRALRSLEPVAATVDASGVRLSSLYLGLPGGSDELFASGTVDFADDPRLDLNLQASLDAAWLRPLAGGLELSGRIEGLAHVGGTLARPEVNGQADLAQGRLLPPGVPHSIDAARALVWFYPDAIVLDRLDASFAGGELSAAGRVDLPAGDLPLAYHFEATARRVAPRWPPGWQLRGDADLSLVSTGEGRQLRGEVRFDRIWYLQDIELTPAQLVQRLLARSRVDVGETDELLATTALGVSIRGPGAVRVRNNVAQLTGSADLALRGTLARPVVFGEVEFEPGGRAMYGGNTYTIDRATLTFANPARIEPLLDVVARTRVSEYSVTLNLSGSLARLNTTFASDPPLPDLDVLGLLATGAPVERPALSEVAAGTPGAESGSASAGALIYGQAASLLTERVGKLFGFDQVRVQPLTSGDAVSAARVTVGKRVSRQLYVTYSYDPTSTEQQILQAEWRLSERLVLVLTQNGSESYAVDARWESRF